jgi:hypothetical protein
MVNGEMVSNHRPSRDIKEKTSQRIRDVHRGWISAAAAPRLPQRQRQRKKTVAFIH